MRCSVCRVVKSPPVVRNGVQDRWHSTAQRTPLGGVQVLFKLFDLTKTEFDAGFLCVLCFDLIAQIESLERQLKSQVERGKREGAWRVIDNLVSGHSEAAQSPGHSHPGAVAVAVGPVQGDIDDWGGSEDAIHRDDHSEGAGEAAFEEVEVEMKRETDDGEAEAPMSMWPSTSAIDVAKDDDQDRLASSGRRRELNTQDENLDFDVTSHKSRSGKAVILYQGFNYVLSPGRGARWKPSRPTRDWRCSQPKCGARLTTFQNDSCVLKDTVIAHDHPRSRNFNVQESNLDFNLSVGRNSRENDSLTYNGYKYRPSQLGKAMYKDRETMGAWKCRFSNCRGRLVTFMNNQCVLKDTVTTHDHPPIKRKLLLYEEFQDTIRKIISDHPEMPPDVVFSSAQLLCPHIPIVKTAPLREFIRRIQAKKRKLRPTEES